ncbi:MAG: aldehyde dehydrogenase family protein [Solirubrobacteraceae bacterium]
MSSDAVRRAAGPQPLWASVPAAARARYLRRAAQAILDEVDDLAGLLARDARVPRTEALLAELLPSVAGLHELADDGPKALADRRLGRAAVLRGGRRAQLTHAPAGVVGIRVGDGSPWAEAVLETASALLAGNGVVLASRNESLGRRFASALGRAGLPDELVWVVAADADLDGCDLVVDVGAAGPKATMLVLDGAPVDRVVAGALWAAYARGGHGVASVGRIVCVPGTITALLVRLTAGARRIRVGDPQDPATEVGPLASGEQAADVELLVAEAEAAGASRLCGGVLEGTQFAPVLLRGVPQSARILHEAVPGPVLSVVEAKSEADAIALTARAPSASVWTGDRTHGERVARSLGVELTWVNEHGAAAPAAPVRLARHTVPHQLASRSIRLRSARWLPYDPTLVRASETAARLLYGRESERLAVVRNGGPAFARVAARIARETLRGG